MKEYYILCIELFTIKAQVLKSLMARTGAKSTLIAEMGLQLRTDLEHLRQEMFCNVSLSAEDKKELQKINEKIMLKYSALKRRFEKQAA